MMPIVYWWPVLTYALCAFVLWEWNPAIWSVEARYIFCLMIAVGVSIFSVASAAVKGHLEIERDQKITELKAELAKMQRPDAPKNPPAP